MVMTGSVQVLNEPMDCQLCPYTACGAAPPARGSADGAVLSLASSVTFAWPRAMLAANCSRPGEQRSAMGIPVKNDSGFHPETA